MSTSEIQALLSSGRFDPEWYASRYPDVEALGMDPAEHYLWLGAELGRKPHSGDVLDRSDLAAAPADAAFDIRATSAAVARLGEPIPHYGKALHQIVERARGRVKQGHVTKEYDVIRDGFDLAYYLMRYPDIAQAIRVDPVLHYIEHGARERRDPSPDFSTRHYVERYPDVRDSGVNPFYHWLTIGRSEGRIAAPFADFEALCRIMGRAPAEVQSVLTSRRKDLRQRFEQGVLGEMMTKAAKLEPLIAHSWNEVFTVKLTPFHSDQVVTQMVAMHRMHEEAEFRRARAVVVIPHCRLSGATRIAGHLAYTLAEMFGPDELIVLRTDLDIMQFPEWFPSDCRHVSLAAAAEKLPAPAQEKLLVEFLRSVRPRAVFNVNSRLFWDTMRPYGKALAASMNLYTYFFCNDKNNFGYWTGYPLQKFYRYFDLLSGVITDSHVLAEELCERYLVPPDQTRKIVTLETPIASPLPAAPAPPPLDGRRPQIFWAGRFDRQKRVDVVYALARRIPNADFHLWGEPVLDNHIATLERPENVHLQGVYADISELPFERCDLWLYTSEWDGVPNMLIEVAMLGVPIVGSIAGGTGEILHEAMSWPVHDIENAQEYEIGVRAVLADPQLARKRALRLRQLVLSRRTPEAYRRMLETIVPGDDVK